MGAYKYFTVTLTVRDLYFYPPSAFRPPYRVKLLCFSNFISVGSITYTVSTTSVVSSSLPYRLPGVVFSTVSPRGEAPFYKACPDFSQDSYYFASQVSAPSDMVSPSIASWGHKVEFADMSLPLPMLPVVTIISPNFTMGMVSSEASSSTPKWQGSA